MTGRPCTPNDENKVSIPQHRTANVRERPGLDEHELLSDRRLGIAIIRVQAPSR